MRPVIASTEFDKINFKTNSHGTIYTFKNYFIKIFSVFSFQQFQIDPYRLILINLVKSSTSIVLKLLKSYFSILNIKKPPSSRNSVIVKKNWVTTINSDLLQIL